MQPSPLTFDVLMVCMGLILLAVEELNVFLLRTATEEYSKRTAEALSSDSVDETVYNASFRLCLRSGLLWTLVNYSLWSIGVMFCFVPLQSLLGSLIPFMLVLWLGVLRTNLAANKTYNVLADGRRKRLDMWPVRD